MRQIKFRAWDKKSKLIIFIESLEWLWNITTTLKPFNRGVSSIFGMRFEGATKIGNIPLGDSILMQFTGLFDKNGKEIYEKMELDGKYEVDFISPKYILRDISTGDILDIDLTKQYEITREYTGI